MSLPVRLTPNRGATISERKSRFLVPVVFLLLITNGCRERSQYLENAALRRSAPTATPTRDAAPPPAISGNTVRGRVLRVIDGDTFVLLDEQSRMLHIRLAGIDAPELKQPFGADARKALTSLALGKNAEAEIRKRERGRFIARVHVDGADLSAELLRRGAAWHYEFFANEQSTVEREEDARLQAAARVQSSGLWSDSNPVAPWTARNGGSESRSSSSGIATLYDGHVMGNQSTRTYYLPGCRGYSQLSKKNRRRFDSEDFAVSAGFRRADGC